MRPEDVLQEAVGRLLEAQTPWGEWSAVLESGVKRFARLRRPEYKKNQPPKHNTFRTIVALEALRRLDKPQFQKHIRRGVRWLCGRLAGDKELTTHAAGMWIAAIPRETGAGLSSNRRELVPVHDLRHTVQAWTSLLWNGVADVKREHLKAAVTEVLRNEGKTKKGVLWSSIDDPLALLAVDEFTSACCVAFLNATFERFRPWLGPDLAKEVKKTIRGAIGKIVPLLLAGLKKPAPDDGLEHVCRSIWIMACERIAPPSLKPAVLKAIVRLKGNTRRVYAAKIRLAAAARSLGWSYDDRWIWEAFPVLGEKLNPPDLAFTILAMSTQTPLEAVPLVSSARRNRILFRELLVRLNILIVLHAHAPGAFDRVWKAEQRNYMESLLQELELKSYATSVSEPGQSVEILNGLYEAVREIAIQHNHLKTRQLPEGHKQAARTGLKEEVEKAIQYGRIRWATDYHSVSYDDVEYVFSPTEAACFRVLFDALRNGTPELGQDRILEEAGSRGARLRDVFRNNKAWKTLIVSGRKGNYRLKWPLSGGPLT